MVEDEKAKVVLSELQATGGAADCPRSGDRHGVLGSSSGGLHWVLGPDRPSERVIGETIYVFFCGLRSSKHLLNRYLDPGCCTPKRGMVGI